jgi:hypothetical protein
MHKGETVIYQDKKENNISAVETLESFLEAQEWFSGNESVSIADLAILATFATIYHVGLDIAKHSMRVVQMMLKLAKIFGKSSLVTKTNFQSLYNLEVISEILATRYHVKVK